MSPKQTSFALVFALWGAGLGAAAQYGKVSVIFDMLPGIYPQAGAALGFAVSLVGFVGILLGVVAGLVVARLRYRRALLTALWAGAAISLFQALLPALPLFMLSRVAEGASHLAIVVAAPTLIAQISADKDRGLTLTLWGTFFGVAFCGARCGWASFGAGAGAACAVRRAWGLYGGMCDLSVLPAAQIARRRSAAPVFSGAADA